MCARGIVPGEWIQQPDEISYLEAKIWVSDNFSEVLNKNGVGYSDGSGGPNEVPREVKCVSFGAATFRFEHNEKDFSIEDLAVMGGQVPGKQTVPRSELWGAIQILCRADLDTDIGLGIDAAYVTNGVVNMDQLCKGSNGDLWSIMQKLIEDRPGLTAAFKIKSHLEDEGPSAIANQKIAFDDLVGNSLADEAAEQVAKLIQPDLNIQNKAKRNGSLGFNVAKRIAIIQAEIWNGNDPTDRILEFELLPKEHNVNQKHHNAIHMLKALRCGHRLVPTTRGYKCISCL